MVGAGRFDAGVATTTVFAGRLETEMFVDEIAGSYFGIETRSNFGDTHIEGAWDKRDGEAEKGRGTFDESGFGSGVFELKEVHAEIEEWGNKEAEKFETEVGEGNLKVEIVESIKAKPH